MALRREMIVLYIGILFCLRKFAKFASAALRKERGLPACVVLLVPRPDPLSELSMHGEDPQT